MYAGAPTAVHRSRAGGATAGPPLTPGTYSLGLLGSGLACLMVGCISTQPAHDYEHAQSLIVQHTGISEVYIPGETEKADKRVAELLTGGLTVDEAVQIALLNNPGFQSQFAEIGASRADLAQSSLLTNPTMSLGLQYPDGGGLADITLGFAAQIADLWQIPVRKQVAEADLERTINSVGQGAVALAASARTAYYRVLALEQGVAYTEENLQLVQRSVALSEAQFQAGEVSEFDVNLARMSVIDVEEQLITTRGQLETARVNLAEVLGLTAQADEIELKDTLPTTPVSWPAAETLLDQALDERFDMRVAWFAVERAEAALRLEYRRFMPDVQLGFAFERNERRTLPGRKILADTARSSIAAGRLTAPAIQSRGERGLEKSQIIDTKLGPTLALALPIFDQNQAQIAKAGIRVLQARKSYEAQAETVAADIQRATSAAGTAVEMLNFLQTQGLKQAQATVEGARRRYQAGEENILVLVEAQDSLVKRRLSYVNSLRDYAVALAALEEAVGGRVLLEPLPPPAPTTQPSQEP